MSIEDLNKFMDIFPDDKKDIAIYRILRKNFGQEELAFAYEQGLIPIDQLEDGGWYRGHCRNAGKARWDAARQVFVYMRTKFMDTFEEDIKPPELDDGFDIFVAVEKININEEIKQD